MPILLAAIVALGLVALIVSRNGDSSEPTTDDPALAEQQPVRVDGSALPMAGPAVDPAVGVKMPDLHGKNFEGRDVDITADGTPKLIFFLAHWCPHCQAEVPKIVDWIDDRGAPAGIGLYSVSTNTTSSRPNYPPSDWLTGERWPIPVLADDAQSSAANAVGLNAFPFFVATDGTGKVVARSSGELTIPQIEAMVAKARGAAA